MFTGKTLVVGTGKSGTAAANLLKKHEVETVLFDSNVDLDIEGFYEKHPELAGIPILLGDVAKEKMKEFSHLVLSPGVACDLPLVNDFREAGVDILGEIELAYLFGKGKILGITGTNGKTTTTALVGEICKSSYRDVQVVGNIGIPYTEMVDRMTEETVSVCELSSFQLETVSKFCPQVSAILNLTEDHLNRHYTMENYGAAKARITVNQTENEVCVLNYDNEFTREFAKKCPARVIFFSSTKKLEEGLFLEGDTIIYRRNGKDERLMDVSDMHLVGTCNYENVMAAIAMTDAFGISMERIIESVKNFHAVEHRIEYVCTKRGVKFYNDSKGTNPDAAIQGIRAMKGKTCLIGGGYDKKSIYEPWIQEFGDKVKKLVLIGQTKEDIAKACERCGFTDYVFAKTLEEAIDLCYDCSEEGENVLLSPACASWGMFPNYEERGRIFKEYVRNLSE